jgi:hypothetical protein
MMEFLIFSGQILKNPGPPDLLLLHYSDVHTEFFSRRIIRYFSRKIRFCYSADPRPGRPVDSDGRTDGQTYLQICCARPAHGLAVGRPFFRPAPTGPCGLAGTGPHGAQHGPLPPAPLPTQPQAPLPTHIHPFGPQQASAPYGPMGGYLLRP